MILIIFLYLLTACLFPLKESLFIIFAHILWFLSNSWVISNSNLGARMHVFCTFNCGSTYFSLSVVFLVLYLRRFLPNLIWQHWFVHLLKSFIAFCFYIFKYIVHFKVIFMHGVRLRYNFIFCLWISSFPQELTVITFLLNCLCTFVES